ncbi:phenylalanine--tRNA ligase beta subunit-related protein [Candidatus Similichlamydia laticola]|uniref:phenylalanine--tRNA ligase n=1 Tax=Candidatus Similichlamydia laticola TaxID=2170265 RepID=A0A369KGM7_9BACT|nr:phenylalanine--tRNA ligase beta subunit-related protein [Candidatus Similichlamydia laticola]RDB31855.1 Phenylalanyl-tRNA synthetase beta chain [Candidatus Similichlamydia laticola]
MEVPFCWLREWLVWDHDPRDLIPVLESCGVEVERFEKRNFLLRESVSARVVGHEEEASCVQLSLGDKGSALAYVPVGTLPPLGSYVPFLFLSQIEGGKSSFPGRCNGVIGSWIQDAFPSVLPLLPSVLSEEGKLLSHWCSEASVFSLSVTPDLSFCQSIRGLALYLSSLKGIPLVHPEWRHSQVDLPEKGEVRTQIAVEAISAFRQYGWSELQVQNACWLPWDLYSRLCMSGLDPGPTLTSVAQYVSINMGYPFLCCDLDRVSDPYLRLVWGVKSSLTVGGKSLPLDAEDVVLKSGDDSLLLSGVTEGDSYRVSPKTKHALVEMAVYEPDQIGRTARRHQLLTPEARLLEHVCSTHAFHSAWRQFEVLCDTHNIASLLGRRWLQIADPLPMTRSIPFPVNLPKRILGLSWSEKEVTKAMKELGHAVVSSSTEQIICSVSTERCDLHGAEDLLDDLVKKIGLDSLPRPPSLRVPLSERMHDPLFPLICSLRHRLCGWGFQEILSLDFASSQKVSVSQALLRGEQAVRLQNPSSTEREFLRSSLLVSFLEHIERNLSHEERSFRLFEIGKVYSRLSNGKWKAEDRLGLFLVGDFMQETFWSDQKDQRRGDLFDLLGWLEEIARTNCTSFSAHPSTYSLFQEGQQADLLIQGEWFGVVGKLTSSLISVPSFFAEICLTPLVSSRKNNLFEVMAAYPGSSRDVTVTLDTFIPYSRVQQHFPAHELLEKWSLLSVYPEGKRQHLTFRLSYRSVKKTLSNEEVEEAHQQVVQILRANLDF